MRGASPRRPAQSTHAENSDSPVAEPANRSRTTPPQIVLRMVMTIHKLTAGDGYTYLTEHIAGGDVDKKTTQDAADYYTAEGNPPGLWIGRGLATLGLDSPDGEPAQRVREDQMRALFGRGLHPDADAIIDTYQRQHLRAGMSVRDQKRVTDEAIAQATLGKTFAAYAAIPPFTERVHDRLAVIIEETGRPPTPAEEKKIRAEEAGRARGSVAGYDVVFAPVKSAALLWALDPRPWVRDAVMAAHHDAKNTTLAMLEEHAAFTRTGTNGIAQIQTKGLIAVSFDHYDSRDGDPNPHTHVAISNKVQGVDGIWRTLDGRAVYRITVAASEHYNTAFQIALTQKLGVQFTAKDMGRGKQPVYEVAGIDPALITGFSSRRRHLAARYDELISAYRHQHGHDPSASTAHKLARRANLDTRDGKKPPRSLTAMRHAWSTQAFTEHGPDTITKLMAVVPDPSTATRASTPARPAAAVSTEQIAAAVVANVAEKRATWTVWNLRAEAERLIKTTAAEQQPITDVTGVSVAVNSLAVHRDLVAAVIAHAISPEFSVSIEAPALLDEPTALRRSDGVSVFVQHAATRYTSTAVLDAEQRLVTAATTPASAALTTGDDSRNRAATPAWVSATLDGFEATTQTTLDAGQRALVTAFTTDPSLLVVGIGAAGTGKTTAMRAYLHTLTAQRRRLIPLATSAGSAAVLAGDLHTPAENVHKFLYEHHHGTHAAALSTGQTQALPASKRQFAVGPGDVILIDEAGMAGTPTLDRITAIATYHGASVRLLGDYRQLAAVESGGALRLIASDVGAVELSTLHRFSNPAEATATLQLRTGDTSGLTFYSDADRVNGGSAQAMTEAVYAGWSADIKAGKVSVMSAATNTDVTALSARARADRVAIGDVEADGIALHDGNTAGVGDWIVTRQNERRITTHQGKDFVRNGYAWHIDIRHDDGSLTVRHLGHNGRVHLPADYAREHVELLYASTVHRTQGSTVDTAHALISAGMQREHLYVALTRAQHSTTLYVTTHEILPLDDDERMDASRRDPHARAALEVLHTVLATEGAQVSATQAVRDAQNDAESLATLVPRYVYAVEKVNAARYRQLTAEIIGTSNAARLFDDPNWLTVSRALAEGEAAGWTAKDLLRAGTRDENGGHNTATLSETGTARSRSTADQEPASPAGILAERIRLLVTVRIAPTPMAAPSHADAVRYAALISAITGQSDASGQGLDPAAALIRPIDHQPLLPTVQPVAVGNRTTYGGALGQALGSRLAQKAIRESAWPAVQAALGRLEAAGYDPADVLKQVTNRRELSSARSIGSVLAWRLGEQELVRAGAAFQPSPTGANPQLSALPGDAVNPPADTRWPALAWILKAQENVGNDITRILPAPADQAAETADTTTVSLTDLLTHACRFAATTTQLTPHTDDLPPWAPRVPGGYSYAATTAEHLQTRVRQLADDTLRARPDWAQILGQAPTDPETRATWLHHIGVIAAYREQHQTTDDDPHRPLGPYREKDHPDHRAYWHAAHAMINAHHLTHAPAPDDKNMTGGTTDSGRIDSAEARRHADGRSARSDVFLGHRVAADIYRALPEAERLLISAEVAAKLGHLWFGPDTPTAGSADIALTQPVHAPQLRAVLTERGHLALPSTDGIDEPRQTAGAAHRIWRPSGRSPETDRRPQRASRPEPQTQPSSTRPRPASGQPLLEPPPQHQQQPARGPRLLP